MHAETEREFDAIRREWRRWCVGVLMSGGAAEREVVPPLTDAEAAWLRQPDAPVLAPEVVRPPRAAVVLAATVGAAACGLLAGWAVAIAAVLAFGS